MAVDLYEATLDDVNQLLTWDVRRADAPQPSWVEQCITIGAAELAGLVGDLAVDNPCSSEARRLRARMIVALYAAAMAEDAHYPEYTSDRDAGDYAARLWQRHQEQRDALVVEVQECRDGVNPDQAVGKAAASFPWPPLVCRDEMT